jgi:hypothetical protein
MNSVVTNQFEQEHDVLKPEVAARDHLSHEAYEAEWIAGWDTHLAELANKPESTKGQTDAQIIRLKRNIGQTAVYEQIGA